MRALENEEEKMRGEVERHLLTWDTVGSPVGPGEGVSPPPLNRGCVVGPARGGGDTPSPEANQEQPTLWSIEECFAWTARRRPRDEHGLTLHSPLSKFLLGPAAPVWL